MTAHVLHSPFESFEMVFNSHIRWKRCHQFTLGFFLLQSHMANAFSLMASSLHFGFIWIIASHFSAFWFHLNHCFTFLNMRKYIFCFYILSHFSIRFLTDFTFRSVLNFLKIVFKMVPTINLITEKSKVINGVSRWYVRYWYDK